MGMQFFDVTVEDNSEQTETGIDRYADQAAHMTVTPRYNGDTEEPYR